MYSAFRSPLRDPPVAGAVSELAERLGAQLPGTIVTTAGGCAAHLVSVLGDRVQEFSAYVTRAGGMPPLGEVRVDGRRARVALQDSCHLRNGLGVSAQPRALIGAVADFVPVQGDGSCCGSAGTYSLLRPADAPRGRWLPERVDLAADWRAAFGGEPPLVQEIAVGTDVDDTASRVDAAVEAPVLAPCG